jgi:hypothetical protein
METGVLGEAVQAVGGVSCVNGKQMNFRPFVNWRKRLMTYAATCQNLRSTAVTGGARLDTPLTPLLYSALLNDL